MYLKSVTIEELRLIITNLKNSVCGWNDICAPVPKQLFPHYDDVIMDTMASQITNLPIAYSTVYLGAD